MAMGPGARMASTRSAVCTGVRGPRAYQMPRPAADTTKVQYSVRWLNRMTNIRSEAIMERRSRAVEPVLSAFRNGRPRMAAPTPCTQMLRVTLDAGVIGVPCTSIFVPSIFSTR